MAYTDYSELTRLLLAAVPEVASVYHEEKEFSGEEFGPHVVYGDVLVERVLIPLLESVTPSSHGTLSSIFAFLEQLANDDNPKIRDVIAVTVCERLGDDPNVLQRARSYMGHETLKISKEIERFWGRE